MPNLLSLTKQSVLPNLVHELVFQPVTTMASADCLVSSKTKLDQANPPVNGSLHKKGIPYLFCSFITVRYILFPLKLCASTWTASVISAFGMMCYLDRPIHASYAIPVRTFQLLQSRLLQTNPCGKRPSTFGAGFAACYTPTYFSVRRTFHLPRVLLLLARNLLPLIR